MPGEASFFVKGTPCKQLVPYNKWQLCDCTGREKFYSVATGKDILEVNWEGSGGRSSMSETG